MYSGSLSLFGQALAFPAGTSELQGAARHPEDLDEEEVERLAPHAIVRDDDGVERWSIDGVVCWAGIIIDDSLNVRISMDGRISEIHDLSLEEFIAALDETEGLIFAADY